MSKRSRSLQGLRRDHRKQMRIDTHEPDKRDFPLIRTRILEASLSEDFEEARREWEFINIIDDSDERFTDQCQLCNQKGLKDNYEIVNSGTGIKFLVGSRCIKRFLILKGATSEAESIDLFTAQESKIFAKKRLQALLASILMVPTFRELMQFREASKTVLGSLDNKAVSGSVWIDYIHFLLGPLPQKEHIDRIKAALFDHKAVPIKKIDMKSMTEEEARLAMRKKAKARVRTTLSKSSLYKPDRGDHS